MAELLGAIASGVTLAALFKACIEAFDLIQISRHQEVDFKKLKLRLNIEKCRLYIWGESMGLTDTTTADEYRPIDRFRFPEVVREILDVVLQLFHDSQKIRDKYGCRQATSEDLLQDTDQNGPVRSLAASFSNFSIQSIQRSKTSKIVQNVCWVIHDRKKFGALVAEIKDLIDSLQGITSPSVPVARQAGIMRRKIASIRDAETLSLIAEVCSEDHPDIADAASTKADTMSLASTHNRRVVAWTESIEEADIETGERMSPDLESLTVTELKHKLLSMIQEKKEREASSFSVLEPLATSALPELSPSAPESATDDSNMAPPSYVPQTTEQFSFARTQEGSANMHDHVGHQNLFNRPYFTNPWVEINSPARAYPPLGKSSPDLAATEKSGQLTYADSLNSKREPLTDSAISQGLDAFRKYMIDISQQTPRNIYGTRTPGTQADTYVFPTTSSFSSYSASSNFGYPYYAGSTSGSVDEPTDYSSVTSDAVLDYDRYRSKVSSPSKMHKCKICDKSFTRPSSLQTHIYSHTGEKPFACEVEGCGRHFSVVANLRRHRKVHKREDKGNELDSQMEI